MIAVDSYDDLIDWQDATFEEVAWQCSRLTGIDAQEFDTLARRVSQAEWR